MSLTSGFLIMPVTPRSSSSSPFTPLCSDSRVVWHAHLGLHPLRNLAGFTAWDGGITTARLRRKPSTCSQGLAS